MAPTSTPVPLLPVHCSSLPATTRSVAVAVAVAVAHHCTVVAVVVEAVPFSSSYDSPADVLTSLVWFLSLSLPVARSWTIPPVICSAPTSGSPNFCYKATNRSIRSCRFARDKFDYSLTYCGLQSHPQPSLQSDTLSLPLCNQNRQIPQSPKFAYIAIKDLLHLLALVPRA